MYPEVTALAPLPDGMLYVELDSGECGIFDMKPYMRSDFFSALKNEAYFNRAFIEYGVVTWPNGQDISPSTVRMEMVRQPRPHGINVKTPDQKALV